MSVRGPVLVIGHDGQLARSLRAVGGKDLVALGRPDVDLTQEASLKAALQQLSPALVVNAAAYTAVDAAENNAQNAYALNADGPGVLATLCARQDLPLIHISTDYVFDGRASSPYDENDETAPLGVYGQTKRAGEMAVQQAHDRAIIIRTAWVFSPWGQNFVKTMLRLAAGRDTINVVDDQFGNPTYAPHLAQAILLIAGYITQNPNFEDWGIYHLAGTGQTHWAGLAETAFAASRALGGPVADVVPIPASQYPTPAPRPANSRMNCNRAKQVFGVALPDWQMGVHECVGALMRNADTDT